jgi:hypothetical protein
MPAAKLPKKLHARLDYLAARVRKARLLRATARAAFLVPAVALLCILADAYLGLPMWARLGLFAGWGLLLVRSAFQILRSATAPVDLEAVASAVEVEFPRLAERLTTAVELAGSADESNGSPALIDEVIYDADTRARKLDLAAAFPTGGALASCVTALVLLLALLIPAFVAPRGGELTRRFFLPWYAPSPSVPYRVVVSSGDPAVKRGTPITLTAYVEPTEPDAALPTSATLVLVSNGKEERIPMSADEPNVWHARRPAAEADFDYRVEAGGAVSDTHHVTVVDPITLASARVSVKPPAYAARPGEPDATVEGLGELAALEHSTITFDLKLAPRPSTAVLEFTPEGTADHKPPKKRTQLQVGPDGSVTMTVPARESGTFALIAVGDRGVQSEFPAQPLRVHKDEPPKLPRVAGLAEKPRQVRPTEKIVVECAATDDVAVSRLVLEWKVDNGPAQTLPLEARGLPAAQVEGKVTLPLADKVKVGQKLLCRLAVTDNRDLPEANLKPQTVWYPGEHGWSEFEIDANAPPLAEQDIQRRKEEIEAKLREIRTELKDEDGTADLLRRGTANGRPLSSDDQEKLTAVRNEVATTAAKVDDLARDVGLTPDLGRLAEALRGLSDREMRDADSALARARESRQADDQSTQFKKAQESLAEAVRKIDDLITQNEQTARDRQDKRKLEDLARDQQELADQAKTADAKAAAELAKKQKELEEQLNRIREQSDALKKSADAARAEDAKRLADAAKKIAGEMRDLDQAMKKAERDTAEERLAELKKKQEELARKAKELADQTDAASRVAQTPPLKPDDAAQAKAALENGDLDEAAKQQEKARQELERLARDLEQAAANTRDPREAAKQLARLQDELRHRLTEETKDRPLDRVPAERRAALEKQQEAIERAAARLKVPESDIPADTAKQRAVGDTQAAKAALKKGDELTADKRMKDARGSLEALADKLQTRDERLARARAAVADLKAQQEAVRQKAEAAAKASERQDPDSPDGRKEIAWRMAEAAQKQAAVAEKLAGTDTPGHEARKDRAVDTLQRAAADLTAGRPQDAAASQLAARRELERLEQALNGQTPVDEKATELARRQRDLAAEAAKNAAEPDRDVQRNLQRRQAEIAREVEKLPVPEAATAQAEAADAARKAEAAGAVGKSPAELAQRAQEAADKLDTLNQRVNGEESPADAADRLARKQKTNADEQERRKTDIATGEARRKAGQELDELKNLRPGENAQKARQRAEEALQRAKTQLEPEANANAQRAAADALKDLADRLTREKAATAKRDPAPVDPADAAERLARKQRELAERTKQELEAAKQKPGDQGQKAAQDTMHKAAREQAELARQAGELPGRDSPKDRQQAQEAMTRAKEELDRENQGGAAKKQAEAADALDRLARKAQERKQDEATAQAPGLPTKAQADAARELAEEQRRLQEEARKAADDLARENAPRPNNPVGDLAKQQQEIARQADELARNTADRQGPNAEPSKQARQAADAAKQASNGVKNGDLTQAKESGRKASEALERMARDKTGGESARKAGDLARRQGDVNQKLDELAKDAGAARAQQGARQQELEQQARDLGKKLEDLAKDGMPMDAAGEKTKDAAASAKQAGDQMQTAQEAGRKGQKDQAGQARDRAAQAMDQAARQAGDAAGELAGGGKGSGSPQAGKAMEQAKGQMGEAGKQLGQGQPGPAGGAMEKAAQSLQQAANQLGQGSGGSGNGPPKPGQGMGGANAGGNIGGPGGTLDLRGLSPDVAQHTGKKWGELPGEIKTKVIQEMRARYGEDYARNIKLYFEQLAERK